jgi:hypothetical protein
MAQSEQRGLILTHVLTDTVTANTVVEQDGSVTALKGIGVALQDGVSGDAIPIAVSGIVNVTAGAAVTAGALVTADSAGKVRDVAPASSAVGVQIQCIGRAITGSSGADVHVQILIAPCVVIGTQSGG